MKYINIIIIFCSFIIHFSCKNDDFSPYGEFQNKLILSSILDTRTNIQFIKIQHTYLPTNINLTDSGKSNIKNLKVYFSFGDREILLKDTIVQGLDNYKIFYTNELIPERGSVYTARAESDEFQTVQSAVQIPAIQYISVFTDEQYINLDYGALNTKGYLYGLYIDYEVVESNSIKSYTIQVPFKSYSDPNNPDIKILEFPELTKDRATRYPLSSLVYSLVSIAPGSTQKIKIKKAYAIVYSFDVNLYNYILSVSGFNDPYSVRLDQPFYSNIKSGYGLFGAIACDTQKFIISNDFIKALNYIDDQQ